MGTAHLQPRKNEKNAGVKALKGNNLMDSMPVNTERILCYHQQQPVHSKHSVLRNQYYTAAPPHSQQSHAAHGPAEAAGECLQGVKEYKTKWFLQMPRCQGWQSDHKWLIKVFLGIWKMSVINWQSLGNDSQNNETRICTLDNFETNLSWRGGTVLNRWKGIYFNCRLLT